MANRIGNYMKNYHTKFINGCTPTALEKKDPEGPILVTYSGSDKEAK